MMSYKDRQWCSEHENCGNIKCDRKLTAQDINIIEREGHLISFGNMKTDECGYIKKDRK